MGSDFASKGDPKTGRLKQGLISNDLVNAMRVLKDDSNHGCHAAEYMYMYRCRKNRDFDYDKFVEQTVKRTINDVKTLAERCENNGIDIEEEVKFFNHRQEYLEGFYGKN